MRRPRQPALGIAGIVAAAVLVAPAGAAADPPPPTRAYPVPYAELSFR